MREKVEAAKIFQNSWLVGICCFCTACAIHFSQTVWMVQFESLHVSLPLSSQ